jgi:small GTP-binding protein
MPEDVKVIVIGDSNVGKSSLLKRLAGEDFDEALASTIAVEYYHRQWKVRRKDINLQFWDTAGQERYRNLIPRYYANAHLAVAVYDITSKASFTSLEFWLQELRRYAPSDCGIILIGNKADLLQKRQVTSKDRLPWPTETKHPKIIEVSAKTLKKPNSILDSIASAGYTIKKIRTRQEESEERENERIQMYGEHSETPPTRRKKFLLCGSDRSRPKP